MDIERYKRDMLTTLQGMAHYAMVNNYQISKIMSKLNTLIHRHEKGLPNKECNYLSHFYCNTSYFYSFAQIHKNQTIKNACKEPTPSYINIQYPIDLKFRLIVARLNCEAHRWSNILGILLKRVLNTSQVL